MKDIDIAIILQQKCPSFHQQPNGMEMRMISRLNYYIPSIIRRKHIQNHCKNDGNPTSFYTSFFLFTMYEMTEGAFNPLSNTLNQSLERT
jgi:hypothetical protein